MNYVGIGNVVSVECSDATQRRICEYSSTGIIYGNNTCLKDSPYRGGVNATPESPLALAMLEVVQQQSSSSPAVQLRTSSPPAVY